MKIVQFILIFIFLSDTFLFSQINNPLKEYFGFDTVSENRCIAYGNFVQKTGIIREAEPQFVSIINIETNHISSIIVKPLNKTGKETVFAFYVRPGTYEILNYIWTKKILYVVKTYSQTIQKNLVSEDTSSANSYWYKFTIEPNTLNYLGTWHFEESRVYFVEDKIKLDKTMKKKFGLLNYSRALLAIPN